MKIHHSPNLGAYVAIDMDEAEKAKIAQCCNAVIDVIQALCPTPMHGLMVLKLCTDSLKEAYDMRDAIFVQNPTEKKQ
ncbi:MAG: hypothetical protein HRJ53_12900 [Acidobacteria bacterium Pan2503]|uniref:Uncharacterized protein n=1 Tax=Candidatus Acidiferrum panamense TaxID=2741543 RepID=A0A7V8SXE2_9BACT|nr:hypothetical protein [Candidatus Acidoferrum panamensis]